MEPKILLESEAQTTAGSLFKYSVSVLTNWRAGHGPQAGLEIMFDGANWTFYFEFDMMLREIVCLTSFEGQWLKIFRENKVTIGEEKFREIKALGGYQKEGVNKTLKLKAEAQTVKYLYYCKTLKVEKSIFATFYFEFDMIFRKKSWK